MPNQSKFCCIYFCFRCVYDYLRSLDITCWNGDLFSRVWVLRNLFWFTGCRMYLPAYWSKKVQLRSRILVDYHGCRMDSRRPCRRLVAGTNPFNLWNQHIMGNKNTLFCGETEPKYSTKPNHEWSWAHVSDLCCCRLKFFTCYNFKLINFTSKIL